MNDHTTLARRAATAGIALTAALGLAGCNLPGEGGDPEAVQAAVLKALPNAEQVVAQYGADGLTTYVAVLVQLPGVAPESSYLTKTIDTVLAATWASSVIEPSDIRLRITPDPIPEGVQSGSESVGWVESIDLVPATTPLGFDDFDDLNGISVSSEDLATRYGKWSKP